MNKSVFESFLLGMHSVENCAFSKILKLFIRSDYVERNCIWLYFKECILPIK